MVAEEMTMRLTKLSLVFLVVLQGCFYSPWESLRYEAVHCPKSHAAAEVALVGGVPSLPYIEVAKDIPPDRYESFKIGEIMCSVMLVASGYYQQERGPYTVWLSLSELCTPRSPGKAIKVKSVLIRRSGTTLWRQNEFFLRLDQNNEVNRRIVAFGDRKMLLPDVLNPKDGKIVSVEVTIESEIGSERTIVFDFRPKVEKGKAQTLG